MTDITVSPIVRFAMKQPIIDNLIKLPFMRSMLKKSFMQTFFEQPLTYGTYGAMATTSLLAMIYNDRAVFTERREKVPFTWPLLGSTFNFVKGVFQLHEVLGEGLNELETDTYSLNALVIPHMIFTIDPANIEHVLKNNFENYIKGPNFSGAMNDLFGHGIFNANGEEWKFQRKTASHIFNVKNMRDQITDVFIDKMKYMSAHLLDKAAEQNKVIDFHDLMYKYTLDSFIQVGFGVHLNSLCQEHKVPFAAAFDDAQKGTFFRIVDQFWPILEPIGTFFMPWIFPDMKASVKIVDEYVHQVIARRREELVNDKTEANDLLSRFMMASNSEGVPLTNDELRDIVMNFVIAGRDTTAQALSWCFYMLTTHPRVERVLLEEIHQHVTDELLEDSSALYNTIKDKMIYTHAVFYETLRLYPSVPLNQKYALKDDMLPDGTHIKSGDYFVWSPYQQGRSEKVWGADAKHFRPERWIDEDGELKRESQSKWPVFHVGPRTCLGQTLATLEAVVVIISLLRKYKFTLCPGQDVTYQVSLTLPMQNGLKLSVEKR
ncbi:cytochrome P450 [Chlamydoabsidia padenii]|nr:cytochrome P450 [Chlamydoabsidia padenii]